MNLADLVDSINDSNASSNAYYLDLEVFSEDLYLDENQIKPESVEIQEMSLQGIFPIEEKKGKIWTTSEDKSLT